MVYRLLQDVYKFDEATDLLKKTHKPLLAFFVGVLIKYTQNILTICSTAYYFFNGASMVKHLDSHCFREVYWSQKKSKYYFIMCLTAQILFLGPMCYNHLAKLIFYPISMSVILDVFSIITLAVNRYFPCFVLLYQQFATRKALSRILTHLEASNSQKTSTDFLLLFFWFNNFNFYQIKPYSINCSL